MGGVDEGGCCDIIVPALKSVCTTFKRSGERGEGGHVWERDSYREDIFRRTLSGGILNILFPRHLDFIIRIPSIGIEH